MVCKPDTSPYLDKGDPDRAIEDFTKAVNLEPKQVKFYSDRAFGYKKKGDLDHALEDYTKAISLEPNQSTFYTYRAVVYKDKGELDRALEDYESAINFVPKRASAYAGKGDVLQAKGDLDRAIEFYGKAINLDPRYTYAYHARGDAYKARGDVERANADFQKSSNRTDRKPLSQAAFVKPARLSNKPDPWIPPTSGSMKFPGCGINPSTFKFLEQIPAILLAGPFGLASPAARGPRFEPWKADPRLPILRRPCAGRGDNHDPADATPQGLQNRLTQRSRLENRGTSQRGQRATAL